MTKAAASPRGSTPIARVIAALASSVVALSSSACTATSSKPPSPTPVSSTHASPTSTVRPSNRTIELSCADATTSGIAPTGRVNLAIGGLTIEGLAGNVGGSAAADVGLHVPNGPPLFFAKAPVYLKPATPATTITLAAASGRYLAWVPARIWTGGGPIDLTPWMATTVVFAGCPNHAATYLGGLLSTDSHICSTLLVTQAATKPRTARIGSSTRC